MKHDKKNNERLEPVDNENRQRGKEKGFTLVETLVSLLLVTLAVVFISNTLITAIEIQRNSEIRFRLFQEMENCKNELNCKPFDAFELKQGSYSKEVDLGKISWQITDISPTLKILRLFISSKKAAKRSYFYKSKYINNNDQS
jgi:prepilin-type N-terminal cleavage/methylation domain-containing protein